MYAIRRGKAAIKAWYWAVSFRRRGKPYTKVFYDLSCGGNRKALALAIAWRDEKLAELETFTVLEFHQQRRSNNVSGVPGVHFHQTAVQPLGFWQANIKLGDGRRVARSFSVKKFGAKEAFKLAVAARLELLRLVDDRPYLKDSVAKRFASAR